MIVWLWALALNLSAYSSEWKLGGYQKGMEIRLSSGALLKQHHELPLNLSIGYLSRVTTSESGAVIFRQGYEIEDKIWLAPGTEISTLTQDMANILVLAHGRLRIRANVTIRTLLGDCSFTPKQDVVLDWKPTELEFGILVLEGQIQMPCFDFDKPISLKQGEAALFLADRSGGAPVFDLLPSGRKMPRGLISQKPEVLKGLEFDWVSLQKALEKQATPPPPPKKKVMVRTCSKPSADFGKCMIKKVADKGCILYRCSAQGTWEYGIELGQGYNCDEKGKIVDCVLE
jgi:hypothetical protein